jgi:arylsulfatase A-like enzyme
VPRPNIVMVMADQMAGPVLPCYGHPVVRAPHITHLAREGVAFASAYCASPLCAPSRASLMIEQLPSRMGAYDNVAEFPSSTPTVAHYLRNMGYHTSLCGNMHFTSTCAIPAILTTWNIVLASPHQRYPYPIVHPRASHDGMVGKRRRAPAVSTFSAGGSAGVERRC